ncbi:MAG: long-chain fatty acid--CoA ligase [Caenibius sp.]
MERTDSPYGPGGPADVVYGHVCDWNITFEPLCLPRFFEKAVSKGADKPLIDFLGRTYSYIEMLRAARAFAAGLQQRGIGPDHRVGLFLPNVPTYVAAYYGAMIAGATVVNFSPLYTVEELEAQVIDSGTDLLVTVDVAALLPTALEVLDNSPLQSLVVARLGAMLPLVKRAALALFGRSQTTPIPHRDDVVRWPDFLSHKDPAALPIDPGETALLQYTGGTTGTPKGAMLSHQNLTANARQVRAIDPYRDRRDVVLGALPLFHVFANTCVMNRTIANGGCIAMLPRFDAGQVLKTIERVRPTSMFGVPTMFQALAEHKRAASTDFSSLREFISGGAPLPLPLKERFETLTGVKVIEGYGLTESAGVVSTNPLEGEQRPGTIGLPLPATRIRLLDKEDPARDVADGEPGELAVAGPQVMAGYWNRPDAAANVFTQRDGVNWLRTGDIATIDSDGFIQIVDRSKDMIAVGGFKVFPSRVENVLVTHPAVREALVIGVPDEYHGEMPKAYVSLNAGAAPVTGEELREWLDSRVGKHERVIGVEIRDELPKTMIGKLDRKALKQEIGLA